MRLHPLAAMFALYAHRSPRHTTDLATDIGGTPATWQALRDLPAQPTKDHP